MRKNCSGQLVGPLGLLKCVSVSLSHTHALRRTNGALALETRVNWDTLTVHTTGELTVELSLEKVLTKRAILPKGEVKGCTMDPRSKHARLHELYFPVSLPVSPAIESRLA